MRRLVLGLLLTLPVVLPAQERLTLTTPIDRTVTDWTIDDLHLDADGGRVVILLKPNVPGEKPIEKTYDAMTTPTGQALLNGLNTANLSTTCATQASRNCGSLRRRIFHRLRDDGVIGEGTVQ